MSNFLHPISRQNSHLDLMDKLMTSLIYPDTAITKKSFPIVDIKQHDETKDTYIDIFLAGFPKEAINIQFEGDSLIVTGNIEDYEENSHFIYHTKQSSSRSFRKDFKLIGEIESTTAEMKDGILTIILKPKKPEPQIKLSKKIEIN